MVKRTKCEIALPFSANGKAYARIPSKPAPRPDFVQVPAQLVALKAWTLATMRIDLYGKSGGLIIQRAATDGWNQRAVPALGRNFVATSVDYGLDKLLALAQEPG